MLEHTSAESATLAEELRNVVAQAEELLRAVGADGNEVVSALKERVYDAVDTAKTRLTDLEQQAEMTGRRITGAAETYIREHPWATVGIAVGVGLILGSVLAHRSRSDE